MSISRTCLCYACDRIPIKHAQKQRANRFQRKFMVWLQNLRKDLRMNPISKIKTPFTLGIHLLLDRKDWHKHQGWKEAIDKELNGILETALGITTKSFQEKNLNSTEISQCT